MKISLLLPSLATNGIARAWILAKLLARHYEVQTLGLLRPDESVFPWFADYPWGEVRASSMREGMREMETRITGDVVVAYCVAMTSFGVGLLAKRRRGIPLILDMPEWEVHDHWKRTGLGRAWVISKNLVGPGWGNPHSFKYRYVLDHLTRFADARLVCCRFLQERYGGVLLPQGPDVTVFDPARFDKRALRRKWGVPEDATIFFFGGNPMPNKGVDDTVAAINALAGKVDARLVIAGRDETHPYTKRMIELSRGNVIALGPQPFDLMPELLATADIVVLPQTRREPKSLGYVPCKMYEAMAMGVPVISSQLCDIPEILDGCGYVVPPDDHAALQATIEHVLEHPEEAREMGRRARQRVVERYSWDVMDATLREAVEAVAVRRGLRPARAAA
jgi:glycosyltransferase involved in cell wall biosynthesis